VVKHVILKGLGNKEVIATLKAVALSVFTLPKAIMAFIAQIKVNLFMQLLILYPLTLQFLYT